jgi:hypothetical protein
MAFFTRQGVTVPEIPNEQQDLTVDASASSLSSKNSSKTSSSSSVLDLKVNNVDDTKIEYVIDRNLGVEV